MRLEISKGSYFVFNEASVYTLREWLFSNKFESYIELQHMCRDEPTSIPFSSQYGILDNPYYIEHHREIGCLINYRYYNSSYKVYKTEFIKNGTCIVNTGSHLLFLEPGEYEILQTGLKVLPSE